jgi:hypothetical protein
MTAAIKENSFSRLALLPASAIAAAIRLLIPNSV